MRNWKIGWLVAALALGSLGAAKLRRGDVYLEHLRFLASDALRGRGNDMPELGWAADYIAQRFAEDGLLPAGEGGSYFQEFEITTALEQGPENEVAFFGIPQAAVHLDVERDFTPLTFGGQVGVVGPLVFAGFGISAPELGYDDYRGLDVRGKIVAVYEHEPQEHSERSVFGGLELTEYSTVLSKALTARSRGALAVVLIPDDFNHYRSWRRDRDREQPLDDLGIQTIRLSEGWGRRLLQLSGRDPIEIRRWINRNLTPYSFEFEGVQASIRVDVQRVRHTVRNVVAVIPGWSDETIVVGAHYDHLGLGGKSSLAPDQVGEIHNGADDNASGTAGLLQLAREFAAAPQPRRTLLFVAFAGEELGLLGSRHYVERPALPLDKTVAMINMDMIGRSSGDLLIGGVGTAQEFKPILNDLARLSPLRFRFAETPGGSSDHQPFAVRGIPVLFFFAGLHGDYHRPSDDWESVDLERSRQILDVVGRTIRRLDQIPGPLKAVDLVGRRTDAAERGRDPAYFGSVPDMRHEGGGLRFEQIREGSPAALAGVVAGDVLVEFDGKAVDSLHDFTQALALRRPGDEVEVALLRYGQLQRLRVVLGVRP